MLYLANPTGNTLIHDAMRAGKIGFIKTPVQGNALIEGVTWCADNGCFGKGYPGDERWISWLENLSPHRDTCLFATAPDVVGRAEESLSRSLPWLEPIRELGFPAALVAQDGMEALDIPWDRFDCLFIGGGTEWKLSNAARDLVAEANGRGKHTHLGRVNSLKRLRIAKSWGCQSVDGTYLRFGPTVNLPNLLRWMDDVNRSAA